jgi:hypothetical protein
MNAFTTRSKALDVVVAFALLQDETKAARLAQPRDGRRRHHHDVGFLDGHELLPEPRDDARKHQGGLLPVVPVFELHEKGAAVGLDGEVDEVEPGDGRVVLHAGRGPERPGDLAEHLLRAGRGGRLGQLERNEQPPFVFGGNEPGGLGAEQPERTGVDAREQHQHERRGPDRLAHPVRVRPRHPGKPFVEAVEEAVQAPRPGIEFDRPEQQRAEGRRERQRHEGRQQHRNGDGDGKLLVQAAHDARDEAHRDEHGRQDEGNGNDRPGNVFHGLARGFPGRESFLVDVMLHGFHHHDGVVHHDADGQHEAKERERVDGKAEGNEQDEGTHDGHRDGKHRDEGGPPVLQETGTPPRSPAAGLRPGCGAPRGWKL